jgi:hypothetical protein
MGSDWSGLCSASSLPAEVTQRMRLNARLVEAAVRTPRMQIGESFTGSAAGLRAQVTEHVGGSSSVTVDSLSWTKILPPPSARGPMLGQDLTDPYYGMTKNQYNRARFNEAFSQMVRGGYRIREAGPKSGFAPGFPDISAVGTDYSGDFPHRPNYRSGRRQRGYTDDNNPLRRGEEEAKIHDGPCSQIHPTMSHADWSSAGEEEEERAKLERRYYRAVEEARRMGDVANEITVREHYSGCPLARARRAQQYR